MSTYLSLDGLRALIVLILAIGQAAMAYWPDLRNWPETISSRSARYSTPVVPIGWAFAIWGLIFLTCFGFAIWHALPTNLDDPFLRWLGWLAAAIFAINVAWESYVPKRDIDWGSVALILLSLVLLLVVVSRIHDDPPNRVLGFLAVSLPFQLFAGWITAATFVNLSSTLRMSGIHIGTKWSLSLLALAVLLGGIVAFITGMIAYGMVIAWALFGIVMANREHDGDAAVARAALIALPIAPVLAVVGALR